MTRQLAGRAVHPVGLGCMNLSWAYGTPPGREDAIRLLNTALDLGYDHLDTANIYGLGKNEELLGEALAGRRNEFLLASKTGIIVDGPRRGIDCSPAAIAESIEASLRRLKTDHIELFYLHRFDPKVPVADSIGALADAIAAGKIGAYGVSEWNSTHVREAHAIHPMAAVQTEYSLWTRNPELGVLDTCRDLGIALVCFSPVARGAVCGVMRDPTLLEEKDLRRSHPRFSAENWPKNLARIEEYLALCDEVDLRPAQLALAWVLSRGDNIHVIPGTTSIPHMEENYLANDLVVPQAILDRAGAILAPDRIAGHRYPEVMRGTIDTEDYA